MIRRRRLNEGLSLTRGKDREFGLYYQVSPVKIGDWVFDFKVFEDLGGSPRIQAHAFNELEDESDICYILDLDITRNIKIDGLEQVDAVVIKLREASRGRELSRLDIVRVFRMFGVVMQ